MLVIVGLYFALAIGALQPPQTADSAATPVTPTQRLFDSLYSAGDSAGLLRELHQRDSVAAQLQVAIDSLDSAQAATATALDALTSSEASPPPEAEKIPGQLTLIGVLFILFLLPKGLQRF